MTVVTMVFLHLPRGKLVGQLSLHRNWTWHLRWKVDYPPSQPVGLRFEPHWRPPANRLSCPRSADTALKPYLSLHRNWTCSACWGFFLLCLFFKFKTYVLSSLNACVCYLHHIRLRCMLVRTSILHVQSLANMLWNCHVFSRVMGAFIRKHIAYHFYLPQSCNHLAYFRLERIFTS